LSFVVRRSSFVVRRSSFVVRRSSFVVRRSSLVARRSSLSWSSFVVVVVALATVLDSLVLFSAYDIAADHFDSSHGEIRCCGTQTNADVAVLLCCAATAQKNSFGTLQMGRAVSKCVCMSMYLTVGLCD